MSQDITISVNVNTGQSSRRVQGLTREIEGMGATTTSSTNRASQGVTNLSGSVDQFGNTTEQSTQQASRGFLGIQNEMVATAAKFASITAAVAAFRRGVSRAIDEGEAYQGQLQDLSAITGIAGNDLERLGDKALEQSVKTGVAVTDQIEGYKLLASQLAQQIDFGTEQGLQQLQELQEETVQLAQAANIDLNEAVSVTAGAINQFGLEVEESSRVVNALAAGAKFGAAEVSAQGQAFAEAGSAASAANAEIETTQAAIQVLAQNAIEGSKAGTSLRNIFTILQTESERLAEHGIENVDVASNGLTATLQQLEPLLDDTAAMAEIFGRESLNAAQILVRNADSVRDMEEAVTDTETVMEQAAAQTQSYAHASDRLSEAINARLVGAFNNIEPLLTEATHWFADLLSSSNELSREWQQQAAEVNQLEGPVSDLVDRYSQLEQITDPSVDQQEEMKDIVEELEGVLPATAKRFNEYGDAIGINTDQAEGFIEQQQRILELKTRDEFNQQLIALGELGSQYERIKQQLKDAGAEWEVVDGEVEIATENANSFFDAISGRVIDIEEDGLVNKFRDIQTEMQNVMFNIEQLDREVVDSEKTLTKFTSGVGRDMNLTLGELAETIGFSTSKTEENTDGVEENEEAVEDLVNALNETAGKAQEAADQISGLSARMEELKEEQAEIEDQEILTDDDIERWRDLNEAIEELEARKNLHQILLGEDPEEGQEALHEFDEFMEELAENEKERMRELEEAEIDYSEKDEELTQQRIDARNKEAEEASAAADRIIRANQRAADSGVRQGLRIVESARRQAEADEERAERGQIAATEVVSAQERVVRGVLNAVRDEVRGRIASAVAAQIANVIRDVPFPFNVALAPAAGAAVSAIFDSVVPSFETGGRVGGRRHSAGGTLIEAEEGEFVVNRNSAQAATRAIEYINQGDRQAREAEQRLFPQFEGGGFVSFPKYETGGSVRTNVNPSNNNVRPNGGTDQSNQGIAEALERLGARIDNMEVRVRGEIGDDAIHLSNDREAELLDGNTLRFE